MDDNDKKQIAGQLAVLRKMLEGAIAAQMILAMRIEVLQKTALEAFEKLGIASATHQTLAEQLRALEREGCHRLLAQTADNDPNLATELKTLVDLTFNRPPDVNDSVDG